MQAFEYRLAYKERVGIIVADSTSHARKRLKDIGVRNITLLRISHLKSMDLLLNPKMSKDSQFAFYRTLFMQLKGGASIKDSLALLIITSTNLANLRTYCIIWDSINRGNSLSRGLKLAGFPAQNVNIVTSGEETGSLIEAIFAIQEELKLLIRLKKDVQGALYGPLFSLVALWLVAFLAFAGLLPFLYDSVIAPTKAVKVMSPGMLFFFDICLAVRDALPYSAILYYGMPIFVWGGFRMMGHSFTDVATSFGIIGKFRVSLDILQALRIIVRNLEFRASIVTAAAQTIPSMHTKSMRNGMIELVKHLKAGQPIGDSAMRSSLPVDFSMELASAEKTKFFTERLKSYATIVETEMKPMGEKVKFTVSLFVVTAVAVIIGGLFIAVYLPVIKATLSLAS